jgi:signal transduction histidine kinase
MIGASTAEVGAANLPGGEGVRALAASLVSVTARTSGLVDDLLAVSVGLSGARMLKLLPMPAAELLAEAAEAARPLLSEASLRLEVETIGWLPIIHVDAARILRVFANLLDNAVKFTPEQGRVRLAAERIVGGTRFLVENSGTALTPRELAGMFRQFWQAGPGDRRGAGLGLSICRSIVEAHGGTIWAEAAKGERVRVCFVVPRKAALESALVSDAEDETPGGRR